jgi:hypothetical protein
MPGRPAQVGMSVAELYGWNELVLFPRLYSMTSSAAHFRLYTSITV